VHGEESPSLAHEPVLSREAARNEDIRLRSWGGSTTSKSARNSELFEQCQDGHEDDMEVSGGSWCAVAFAATHLLQANLNHSRSAQDMLLRAMIESDSSLAVSVDPYNVPDIEY